MAQRRSMSGIKTAPLHRCALGGPGWKWQIAGGFYHTHIYSHILSDFPNLHLHKIITSECEHCGAVEAHDIFWMQLPGPPP